MAFFRVVLQDPKTWKNIIEAASGVMEQLVFHATAEGLRAETMDPIRVMMIRIWLPKETFDEYECTEPIDLAVNLEDMAKILRRTQGGDTLTMRAPEKDGKLQLIFKGSAERTFALSLLDTLKFEEQPLPKTEGKTTIRLTSDALGVAVKDAAIIEGADQLRFSVDDGTVIISAEGDTGYMRNEFRKGSEALLDLDAKDEKPSAHYSIEYLGDMMKAASLSDTIALRFSTDIPLKAVFAVGAGPGQVTYYLAPRRQGE
jgi:proliferating cell nuclear antigen